MRQLRTETFVYKLSETVVYKLSETVVCRISETFVYKLSETVVYRISETVVYKNVIVCTVAVDCTQIGLTKEDKCVIQHKR